MGNTNMIPNIASNGYPHVDNVNTWSSETQFNYSLWAANCKLTMTRVPWDSDYKNVVKFSSPLARNAYFDSLDSISQIINKATRIPKEGIIMLPFNYDEVMTYNYLVASNPLPIGYEQKSDRKKTRFYYFITDMEYKNANVTECHIELDYWTTFIDDIEIGESVLHRGHAPMSLKTVEQYLADPTNNTDGLLTPDVNFGPANNIKKDTFVSFHSGTQYVLIATTSDPTGNWSNNVTHKKTVVTDGVPNNIYVFAMAASDYGNFINYMNNSYPQFIQTIQALFFVDEMFITLGSSFTISEYTCYNVVAKDTSLAISLSKADFSIPSDYDWITKLYTSPYSVLEVTDNNGKVIEINVEDTSSNLGIVTNSSFAYPFLDIKAFITGIGGKTSSSYAIKKFTLNDAKTIYNDNWQKFIFNIDVPTYGIFQKSSTNYDFATRFDRAQRQNDINTSFNNSKDSIQLAYDNDTRNIQLGTDIINTRNTKNTSQAAYDALVSRDIADENAALNAWQVNRSKAIALLSVAEANIQAGASMGAAAIGMLGSAASGNMAGVYSGGIKALGTAYSASAVIGFSQANTETLYGPSGSTVTEGDLTSGDVSGAAAHGGAEGASAWAAMRTNINVTEKMNTASQETVRRDNQLSTDLNTLQVDTAEDNRDATKSTGDTNNNRTKTNGQNAITNAINQAALRDNIGFGSYGGNAALDAEGLRGIDFKVKTQNDDILVKTGNTFARYGYMFDGPWQITQFNIMTNFTYWEFSDIYIRSTSVFEGGLERLREIFMKGVSVWSDATLIGTTQIKSNKYVPVT